MGKPLTEGKWKGGNLVPKQQTGNFKPVAPPPSPQPKAKHV